MAHCDLVAVAFLDKLAGFGKYMHQWESSCD